MINISIAIPTYNRLDCLHNLLQNMESLQKVEGLNVNYCISAASCNDGTQEYLKKFSENKKNFHINIKKSSRTRWNWIYLKNLIPHDSDWVWLFGDDDIIINPDGWIQIVQLIEIANKNEAHLISIPQSKRINVTDMHIDTLMGLCSRFGLHEVLGWMTSILMRRSIFVNFISQMQSRFKNVYTDHGLRVKRISPFLHSLILLQQNAKCNSILALKHIVDEQINIVDEVGYKSAARSAEFLKDRLPHTFAEYKEFLSQSKESKSISFFRYVNKTFIDLIINIIVDKMINGKFNSIKNDFVELKFLYDHLDEGFKARYKTKINFLTKLINSNKKIISRDYVRLHSIYKQTKLPYLDNFISEIDWSSRR
jgi:hypothetical protein